MPSIDAALLRRIAPRFTSRHDLDARQAGLLAALDAALEPVMEEYALDQPLRAAHFLAQICEESAGFTATEEEADGLCYEGRTDLGNTEPGDGPRFKGRGLIQLTGRDNYARYAAPPALDLLDHPELAAEPIAALRLACEFWSFHGLNEFADRDDVLVITCRINGGYNGLEARRTYLERAKAALGLPPTSLPPALPLRPGDCGPDVVRLQARLRRLGERIGLDGEFGPETEQCLKRFQSNCALAADGIAGPRSWTALVAAAG